MGKEIKSREVGGYKVIMHISMLDDKVFLTVSIYQGKYLVNDIQVNDFDLSVAKKIFRLVCLKISRQNDLDEYLQQLPKELVTY